MGKKLKKVAIGTLHATRLLSAVGQIFVAAQGVTKYTFGSSTSAPAWVYTSFAEYGGMGDNILKELTIDAYFNKTHPSTTNIPLGSLAKLYKYPMQGFVLGSTVFNGLNAYLGTVTVLDTSIKLFMYLASAELGFLAFLDELDNPTTSIAEYNTAKKTGIYSGALLLGAIPALIGYFYFDRVILYSNIEKNAEFIDHREFHMEAKRAAFAGTFGTLNILGSVGLAYFFTGKGLANLPIDLPDEIDKPIIGLACLCAFFTGTLQLRNLYTFDPQSGLVRSPYRATNFFGYSAGGVDSFCVGAVNSFGAITMISSLFSISLYNAALIVLALALSGVPTAINNFIFTYLTAFRGSIEINDADTVTAEISEESKLITSREDNPSSNVAISIPPEISPELEYSKKGFAYFRLFSCCRPPSDETHELTPQTIRNLGALSNT